MPRKKLTEKQRKAKKAEANRRYYEKRKGTKEDKWYPKPGQYIVYYIPEENYIGYTQTTLKARMERHRSRFNRHTEGAEVICSFDTQEEALWYEKVLHAMGYNGSLYKSLDLETVLNEKICK